MNDEDFLKECEEKVSLEVSFCIRNLERLALSEDLEIDWVILEFRKQFNKKIAERWKDV